MPGIKNRQACNLCDCINEKAPHFRCLKPNYWGMMSRGQERKLAEAKEIQEGYTNESGWICTGCLHPAKNHTFTFKKPGQDEEDV